MAIFSLKFQNSAYWIPNQNSLNNQNTKSTSETIPKHDGRSNNSSLVLQSLVEKFSGVIENIGSGISEAFETIHGRNGLTSNSSLVLESIAKDINEVIEHIGNNFRGAFKRALQHGDSSNSSSLFITSIAEEINRLVETLGIKIKAIFKSVLEHRDLSSYSSSALEHFTMGIKNAIQIFGAKMNVTLETIYEHGKLTNDSNSILDHISNEITLILEKFVAETGRLQTVFVRENLGNDIHNVFVECELTVQNVLESRFRNSDWSNETTMLHAKKIANSFEESNKMITNILQSIIGNMQKDSVDDLTRLIVKVHDSFRNIETAVGVIYRTLFENGNPNNVSIQNDFVKIHGAFEINERFIKAVYKTFSLRQNPNAVSINFELFSEDIEYIFAQSEAIISDAVHKAISSENQNRSSTVHRSDSGAVKNLIDDIHVALQEIKYAISVSFQKIISFEIYNNDALNLIVAVVQNSFGSMMQTIYNALKKFIQSEELISNPNYLFKHLFEVLKHALEQIEFITFDILVTIITKKNFENNSIDNILQKIVASRDSSSEHSERLVNELYRLIDELYQTANVTNNSDKDLFGNLG